MQDGRDERRHEDHRARDDPARGVPEPALGPGPHRRGPVGLGETFFGAEAVEAYLHETAAPHLLGKDPLADRPPLAHALRNGYLGFHGSGAEMRGISAIDIALWDLFGKATGQPVYQLLGGARRDTHPHLQHLRRLPLRARDAAPGSSTTGACRRGEPRDRTRTSTPSSTAPTSWPMSLLEQGITGMKIWPFDSHAEATDGHYISRRATSTTALEPFRKIRQAVGNQMDIMVELHSLWNLPTAKRIARALEEFEPFWFEDPLKADNIDALAELAAATHVPIYASARRWPRAGPSARCWSGGAAGIVMLDLAWCGGLSRGEEDRDDGRGLPTAGGAARLHRPGRPDRLDPPLAQRRRTR